MKTWAGIVLILIQATFVSSQLHSSDFLNGTIRINCGGPNYTDLANRTWSADSYFVGGSKLDNSTHGKITSLDDYEPYYFTDDLFQSFRKWGWENASDSIGSYIIPLPRSGTYWVRLFFCEFLTSVPLEDLFSIYLNGYKVKDGYSVANSYSPELLDWSLSINSSTINITLVPQSGSPYLNAIEIVPVPDGEYSESLSQFTNPILFKYGHVNMGAYDTYLDSQGRFWLPYTNLTQSWTYNTSSSISGANLTPDLTPPYIYTSVLLTNTSWIINDYVLSNGYFLIRLHFSEIQYNSSKMRVFDIRFQGKDVLTGLDVFKEVGSNHALRKDFVIQVDTDISAINFEMYPNPNYPNTTLMCSGVEYFFIIYSSVLSSKTGTSSSLSSGAIVGIALGVSIVAILIAVVLFFLVRKRRPSGQELLQKDEEDLIMKLQDRRVRYIPLKEIKIATKNFSEKSVIGRGGFGTVYRGQFGQREWAVKRAKKSSGQTMNDFIIEVDLISQLNHVNLVRLLGLCIEREEKIFVYEFIPNSNVHAYLHNRSNGMLPLTFQQRVNIAIGAARGLNYLHSFASEPLIHRDVKTENILLDNNLQAKIADFGLLKKIEKEINATTKVAGSRGYLDPEYYSTFQVSDKSDVYSFGVVLLELMTGRLPFLENANIEEQNIVYWALPLIKNQRWTQLVDPSMEGKCDLDQFRRVLDLAEICVHQYGQNRPSMAVVVRSLEKILFRDKDTNSLSKQNSNLGSASSFKLTDDSTSDGNSQILKNEDYERMGFADIEYSGQRYMSGVSAR